MRLIEKRGVCHAERVFSEDLAAIGVSEEGLDAEIIGCGHTGAFRILDLIVPLQDVRTSLAHDVSTFLIAMWPSSLMISAGERVRFRCMRPSAHDGQAMTSMPV